MVRCGDVVVWVCKVEGVRFFLQDATEAVLPWERIALVYMTDLLWEPRIREHDAVLCEL